MTTNKTKLTQWLNEVDKIIQKFQLDDQRFNCS